MGQRVHLSSVGLVETRANFARSHPNGVVPSPYAHANGSYSQLA